MANVQYTPGRMVWRELATKDVAKAKRFYGELFGWTFEDRSMGPAGMYTIVNANGAGRGGLMAMHGEMAQMPSHWMVYVSVKDVDAAAKAAKDAGGTVGYGPQDIPEVGRFATILDPDGAAITAFKSGMGDPAVAMPGKGEFCWETLSTKDIEGAKRFYGKVFGWKAGDFGGMPVFGVGDGMENQVADVQLAQGPVPPHWLTFVVVPKVDDAAAHASKLGGQVMMPGMDIPNVGRIAVITDDQGAAIGLFQSNA